MVNMVINPGPKTFMRNMFAGVMCYLMTGAMVYSFYCVWYIIRTLNESVMNDSAILGEI